MTLRPVFLTFISSLFLFCFSVIYPGYLSCLFLSSSFPGCVSSLFCFSITSRLPVSRLVFPSFREAVYHAFFCFSLFPRLCITPFFVSPSFPGLCITPLFCFSVIPRLCRCFMTQRIHFRDLVAFLSCVRFFQLPVADPSDPLFILNKGSKSLTRI